ncbi:MAG: hypothetical protein HYS86_02015 [Candidatus Chisholmbacteria bacterium]|nr:hypothetical protein [Candidatus Chisholmbacteria bacterium]
MMKRLLLPLFIALAVTVLVVGVLLWLLKIPVFRGSIVGRIADGVLSGFQYTVVPESFRTKIYARNDIKTLYPGSGEVRVNRQERLLVIGQGEGARMEEVPLEGQEQINELLSQGHQVESLRANPEYLLYTVGVFQRWEELIALEEGEDEEDLPEARGRLLILGDPTDGAKVYTFHVVAKPVANVKW